MPVIIRHKNGNEKTVTDRAYKIMPASVRKDWAIVGRKDEAGKPGARPKDMKITASFLPEEIAEGVIAKEHAAKDAAIATTMSGEAQGAAAPPPPAAPPVTEAAQAPAGAETAPPAAPQPPVGGDRDDLASLPNLGAKCAEALNAAGINTYAQLAAANTAEVNSILDKANFGPKKAQVPQWKSKAGELAKATK